MLLVVYSVSLWYHFGIYSYMFVQQTTFTFLMRLGWIFRYVTFMTFFVCRLIQVKIAQPSFRTIVLHSLLHVKHFCRESCCRTGTIQEFGEVFVLANHATVPSKTMTLTSSPQGSEVAGRLIMMTMIRRSKRCVLIILKFFIDFFKNSFSLLKWTFVIGIC